MEYKLSKYCQRRCVELPGEMAFSPLGGIFLFMRSASELASNGIIVCPRAVMLAFGFNEAVEYVKESGYEFDLQMIDH